MQYDEERKATPLTKIHQDNFRVSLVFLVFD